MKTAGMLIIICTSSLPSPEKYSSMTPRAGATAVPAITVSSDRESTAIASFFDVVSFLFMKSPIKAKEKSAGPSGLTLSQLNFIYYSRI